MSPVVDALTPVPVQEGRKFNSFAVLDLETANLPEYNYNKVGITELCCVGFAAEELMKESRHGGKKISELPRVLHKISLVFNPHMAIMPVAEELTGLNNFMLEAESKFNENAANTFLGFLKHLRQPVCLVAHNGGNFDFPIVKHILEKLQIEMPKNVHCVDSLRAFHDIDQIRKHLENAADSNEDENTDAIESADLKLVQSENKFDARAQNETTPKRPTISAATAAMKRKRSNAANGGMDDNEDQCQDLEHRSPKSKRVLNFGESLGASTSTSSNSELNLSFQIKPGKRWFPPKGIYKLANIYKRIFSEDPVQTHYAEADVLTLTHLMLHYGKDFTEYAESHAIAFEAIPRL